MRTLITFLFFVSGVAQAAGIVDLTAPGALDTLRQHRPEHYTTVRAILDVATLRPGPRSARWIEANFAASDVDMLQWQVSDPPKLNVSFTLDGTRYTAVVVPALERPRVVPLVDGGRSTR